MTRSLEDITLTQHRFTVPFLKDRIPLSKFPIIALDTHCEINPEKKAHVPYLYYYHGRRNTTAPHARSEDEHEHEQRHGHGHISSIPTGDDTGAITSSPSRRSPDAAAEIVGAGQVSAISGGATRAPRTRPDEIQGVPCHGGYVVHDIIVFLQGHRRVAQCCGQCCGWMIGFLF